MSGTSPSNPSSRLEIGAQADAALRAVRLVLAVLACFVLGAYRPLSGSLDVPSLLGVLLMIVGGVVVLNQLAEQVPTHSKWGWITQVLDVVAIVALAVALDGPLRQQSWVLLVVPVVSAAVRYGSLASVLSWVGGCIGYVLAAWLDAVDATDEVTILARVPGVLLAVAITVGLLARWMREGWEIQNELTSTVAGREHRLAVIEQTQLALNGLTETEAVELCATQVLALGFSAATVEYLDNETPTYALGKCEIIAKTVSAGEVPDQEPVVTVWVEDQVVRGHSVSAREPQTRSIVTGWSEYPIEADQARALASLVAHTSAAVEMSGLLRRLRHNADHDDLTGLANRRTLDQELATQARRSGRLAVAFVDLDDFKGINDRHGHDIGDKALVAVARRLESATGDAGIVARYGGDEFLILLPDADLEQASKIAEAAITLSNDRIAIGPLRVSLGLSLGIATARTPIAAAKLIRVADQALYEAKTSGKSTFVAIDLDAVNAEVLPYMPARPAAFID